MITFYFQKQKQQKFYKLPMKLLALNGNQKYGQILVQCQIFSSIGLDHQNSYFAWKSQNVYLCLSNAPFWYVMAELFWISLGWYNYTYYIYSLTDRTIETKSIEAIWTWQFRMSWQLECQEGIVNNKLLLFSYIITLGKRKNVTFVIKLHITWVLPY